MRRSGKEKDGSMSEMLEKILSDENIRFAKKRVYANKEIIVAMSAVFTPQLLLLSGIGPADELQKLGIKVVSLFINLSVCMYINLPVLIWSIYLLVYR